MELQDGKTPQNTISKGWDGEDLAKCYAEVCQYVSHYVNGGSLCISSH